MAKRTFENMDQVSSVRSFSELRKWRKERKTKKKDLSYIVPQVDEIDYEVLRGKDSGTSITWIGHCTFMIRMAGLNIVTDPVWANSMAIEKRLAPPGIPLDQMPPIDVVLLSHAHYDHLNWPSLRKLKGNPLILAPDGLKRLLQRKGFNKVDEFSWWETKAIGGIEFTFLPAQHWTRRTPWDTNTSHWGGWMLSPVKAEKGETNAATVPTIYFAGDSGYFRGFKEIGERFHIDYALIPIGAYEPEWFMSNQHVNPEEAVQAFLDVKGRYFIPTHYGAFRLADDTPKEALDRLHAEWARLGMDLENLKKLLHGETLRVDRG